MRVAPTAIAVLVAAVIAYIGPSVAAHSDSTLVYLRENGRGQKANLVPAIFPVNTARSVVHDHLSERGFRGPNELTGLPNGEFDADEHWGLNNLLWHYDIRFVYDDEGRVIEGWGFAFEPGAK